MHLSVGLPVPGPMGVHANQEDSKHATCVFMPKIKSYYRVEQRARCTFTSTCLPICSLPVYCLPELPRLLPDLHDV